MSDYTPKPASGETSNEQLVYAPILRDGPAEQNVMQEFGGLNRYSNSQRGDLYTILEVTSEDDLDNLGLYRDASDKVLVDLPEYLTQNENKLAEPVGETLDKYQRPTSFLNNREEDIPIPVLSGTISNPVTYHQYLQLYSDISEGFEQVALRLFIRPSKPTETQIEDLERLTELIAEDDIILLDIIEVAHLAPGEQGRETIQYFCDLFEDQEVIILNAFSSYEGLNYNYGLEIARESTAAGFGDFAINYRFPEEVRIGHIETRKIRQYSPTESSVFVFEGEGYSGAYEALEDWELWDSTHCEFCRRASRQDTESLAFWKRVRMGHYISSVLTEEAT